jgi:hypothetical protein
MTEESVEPAGDDEAERGGEGLLQESAGDNRSGAVFVGEICEGVAESVEFGKDYDRCGTKLEDEGGVDGVLACGAPVDEAGGVGALFGDELSELFDERNGEVGGGGDGGGEGVQVEEFDAATCGDDGRSGGGDDAGFCFGTGEGGFEIEHGLGGGRVRKERFDGRGIVETIEERHKKSVNVPGRRKNGFVRGEGVR